MFSTILAYAMRRIWINTVTSLLRKWLKQSIFVMADTVIHYNNMNYHLNMHNHTQENHAWYLLH